MTGHHLTGSHLLGSQLTGSSRPSDRRRPTRRTVLRGLGVAVLAGSAAAVGGSPEARVAHAATGLPLTVVNNYREPITNHYARVLHENTVDGRAYGFAFDDVADQASYIQDHAPRAVTLTLTPF